MSTTAEDSSEAVVLAHCGLLCSRCGMFARGKCKGCHSEKPMNKHCGDCGVKRCCVEHGYATCAECGDFPDLKQCRKLNNFISKVFGFIFRTNRIANLYRIREISLESFKDEAAEDART